MEGNTKKLKRIWKKVILILNDYRLKNTKYELINSLLTSKTFKAIELNKTIKKPSIYCLSRSIKYLSQADVAYFVSGWNYSRGCKIEHEIAKQYNIKISYITL